MQPTTAEVAATDPLNTIRSCTQRLLRSTSSDTGSRTATGVAENEAPLEVWDIPRHALREAWIAAAQLTICCSLKKQRITATDEAAADIELRATIHTSSRRLIVAWTCCGVQAPTITEFTGDVISGYSTYDTPLDQLREESLAAGILLASTEALGWSIADLLAEVSVSDQVASTQRRMKPLSPDLAEIWRADRARAHGARQRALLDTLDELRAMGLGVAAGVRPSKASGELSIVWVSTENVAGRREIIVTAAMAIRTVAFEAAD